ncbi:MAG: excinuclease ABC subunit UvrA [Candidatus Sumerlaeia bacterium]|nr:excinuclease ABC subunit UvrA [Candidatus Sumerlaeia bacterium]
MARKTMESAPIEIIGAKTHNLKNVSVEIPAGKLTVVTGVSGSGKSSLAFDTLYAEGQRRYVESLSTYARQFISRMPRPDVEEIRNIPPAIALEQKNGVKNARSTVGTATEINDYLRILFARAGKIYDVLTGALVEADTPQTVTTKVLSYPEKSKFYVLAHLKLEKRTALEATIAEIKRQGFNRLFIEGELVNLDEEGFEFPKKLEEFDVMIDRLTVQESQRTRLAEAVGIAFRMGRGQVIIQFVDGDRRVFSESLYCPESGFTYLQPEPRLFSFSNPLGACATCQGFGRVTGIDWGRVVPDPTLSVNAGCIAPWRGENGAEMLDLLKALNHKRKMSLNSPWKEMDSAHRDFILQGEGEWPGVKGYFDWLETKRYKVQARVQLARYRGFTDCPDCKGGRLTREALAVKIGGKNLPELQQMSIPELREWFEKIDLSPEYLKAVDRPLKEIKSRLDYLIQVGLSYLTLARQTRTLSGGEAQRINLATALGSALTETLYVLDEPTVGLHPRDTHRLVGIIKKLTEYGNTTVIVEHDMDVIREADHLIDVGPNAGERGGEILYQGSPKKLTKGVENSKTARFLHGHAGTAMSKLQAKRGRRKPSGWFQVQGAYENNLKYLTVDFPVGVLCVVTGVSGSGKSTLVTKCLYGNYRRDQGEINVEPGKIVGLSGLEQFSEVILIDQEQIGRSSRSNPATYLKAYDGIRRLMADTPKAQQQNITAREFSFNVEGGRCESCEGTGYQIIDMQFLADVEVVCETCEGKRFQDHILEITYNELNINQILNLTIEDALRFFDSDNVVKRGLQPLYDVGLGYLRLGQSTNTLSGGEAQRMKLALHLSEAHKESGKKLLIFDDPTTGLHAADVEKLLEVFEQALESNMSLLVIEHNLELMRHADWIIDLGPDGGSGGGELVFTGPPEELIKCPQSITAGFLKNEMKIQSG